MRELRARRRARVRGRLGHLRPGRAADRVLGLTAGRPGVCRALPRPSQDAAQRGGHRDCPHGDIRMGWSSRASDSHAVALVGELRAARVARSLAHGGHATTCTRAGRPTGEVRAGGWVEWVGRAGGAFDDYATDTCSEGGALVAALGDATIARGKRGSCDVELQTPSDGSLAAATLWRAARLGAAGNNATYQVLARRHQAIADVFDECMYGPGCAGVGEPGEPMAAGNRIVVPPAQSWTDHLSSTSRARRIANDIARTAKATPTATPRPSTSTPPTSRSNRPKARRQATWAANWRARRPCQGTSDVTFSATDPGAGCTRRCSRVDGQVVQRTVLNETAAAAGTWVGRATGWPAFLYVQPCLGVGQRRRGARHDERRQRNASPAS